MQALYSPIAPIHLLEQLYYHNLLRPHLLLLAHDVTTHIDDYVTLIGDWRHQYKLGGVEPIVIMDNSVVELGTPVNVDTLLYAADLVEADVVICPDVIGNFKETAKLMMRHAKHIQEHRTLMFIPQGNTYGEILDCIDWYAQRYPEVTMGDTTNVWWGIPRWITNNLGSRQPIIDNIVIRNQRAEIHLLGTSTNLSDDIRCSRHPNVVGIDSANPLVQAMNGVPMDYDTKHIPRGDYWEEQNLTRLMMHNVQWMHDALSLT